MVKILPTLLLTILSGCVAHIPMEEQAPDLNYFDPDKILISIIDHRALTRDGIDPDVIGTAHGTFGIPSKMKVYPWYEHDAERKDLNLAQALEDRLVIGLNDEGWNAAAAGFENLPGDNDIRDVLATSNARNLLLIVLDDWYVSVNLNWVGGTNFDWGATLRLYDNDGTLLLEQTSGTRHVIPADGSDSYPNIIRRAFRDRLEEILETPEVQETLLASQ